MPTAQLAASPVVAPAARPAQRSTRHLCAAVCALVGAGCLLLADGSRAGASGKRRGKGEGEEALPQVVELDLDGDGGGAAEGGEGGRALLQLHRADAQARAARKRRRERRRLEEEGGHAPAIAGERRPPRRSLPPPLPTLPSSGSSRSRSHSNGGSRDEQFLLTSFIEQQLLSGTVMGLMHLLRQSVVLRRTAVLPRARFDEPAYRSTFAKGHFDIGAFFDKQQMLQNFGCARTASLEAFMERTKGVVEVLLLVRDAGRMPPAHGNAVVRNCDPVMLADINTRKAVQMFTRGISRESKVAEILGGVFKVKEIICVAHSAAKERQREVTAAIAGARSVMMATPEDVLWREPWDSVCGEGASSPAHGPPPIAPQWMAHAKRFAARALGGGRVACVHIRMEKLVRYALTHGTPRRLFRAAHDSASSPYLENCIRGIKTVVDRAVGRAGSGVARFVINDIHTRDGLGTVTAHVSRQDEDGYRKWLPEGERLLEALGGTGYCGSAEFRRDLRASGAPPGSVARTLQENARSCALMEAAVCQRAAVKLRFGGGSYSNHATLEEGELYSSCEAVEKAARG